MVCFLRPSSFAPSSGHSGFTFSARLRQQVTFVHLGPPAKEKLRVCVCLGGVETKRGRVDVVNPGWNLPSRQEGFTSFSPPAPHSHLDIFKSNLFRHVDGEHIADLEEELQGS